MWSISSHNIYRTYYASIFSRSFLVVNICYISAFIIPILILASIGTTWTQYSRLSTTPFLNYQNYQATCLLKDQTVLYDSSFTDQQGTTNKVFSVSVGTISSQINARIYVVASNIVSCSILLYFKSSLNNNKSLVILPISTYTSLDNQVLTEVSYIGTGKIIFSSILPQTTLSQSNKDYYHTYGQSFSFVDNMLRINREKQTLLVTNEQIKQLYSSNSTSLTINTLYQVMSGSYAVQNRLIDKIREFVPYYIYLLVLGLGIIVIPLTRWMLKIRLYTTRYTEYKSKID